MLKKIDYRSLAMKNCTLWLFIGISIGFLLCGCTPRIQEPSLPPRLIEKPSNTPDIEAMDTPQPTLTFVSITPKITATPIHETIRTEDDLERLVRQFYTWHSPCISSNFIESLPGNPPAQRIEIAKVDFRPDPQEYWISEIADNADKSMQAYVACDPALCQDKIYVANLETKEVYEINWDTRMPWRPIDHVLWINNTILAFHQSINPEQAQIMVVDFGAREYLYNALIFPEYACATETPTP